MSFVARYRTGNERCLLGGVRSSESSAFQRREDAQSLLDTALELNAHASPTGEVVEVKRAPDIFIHCGEGPAQAVGGHCFGCRVLLTRHLARELKP